uniref:TIMELESS-interacting protein n=1 Tax=Graphocephala atropunctata TaxID=36148 RepID=A0A1B6LDG2_9HEMI
MLEEIYSDNLVDQPDDIERVIEGEEFERKDESERGSGNEEEKNVDEKDKEKEIKIRKRQGPRMVLNPQRLRGPRGLGVMETFFTDIPDKLRGKGKEKEDLDLVMGRMEHWAHRLMPRLQFDDCLKKIETLGNKRLVMNMVKRIRLGLEENETVPQEVLQREDVEESPLSDVDAPLPDVDPFDELISSSAPTRPANTEITTEQREQMLRNRLIAEERRAARLKRAQEMKEKFQSQQMSNSQSATSQVTAMEITMEENPEKEDNSHQNNVEQEKIQLDAAIGIEENSSNAGLEIGGGCEIENNFMRNKDDPEIEASADGRQYEVPIEEKEVCREVPEGVPHGPEEEDEINPVELRENEDQLDALNEGSRNQPDILIERGDNEGILNGNQPDILVQRGDMEPDILPMRIHESGEVSERNENQPDILGRRNESRPDLVSRFNDEDIQIEERNIVENQPEAIDIIENQPVAMEVIENPQPDILPDIAENQPDILMEGIGSQPDILTERSVNQPDILI